MGLTEASYRGILFPHLYNKTDPEIRIRVVDYYLKNAQSLRKTARKFNVHYQSVFKWVRLYRREGEERLLSTYRRPWNRIGKNLEEKIALMKEKDPTLTVRRAKEILAREGITISPKGIWGVWKRYGYAGFRREKISNEFIEYCSWTKETVARLEEAKILFQRGKIDESARILSSLPFLPRNELVPKIPDRFLNLRRRIEKISCLFGKVPLRDYLKETRRLSKELKRKKLIYSALRIGNREIMALAWSGKPEQQLKRTEDLKRILNRETNRYSNLLFAPRLTLLISEGIAYSFLSRIAEGLRTARACRKLLKGRKNPSPYFMADLGSLYMNLEDYKEAEFWLSKSVDRVDEDTQRKLKGYIAKISLYSGKYREAFLLSKFAKFGEWVPHSLMLLVRSRLSLVKGIPQRAIELSTESLPNQEEKSSTFTYSMPLSQ